MFSKDLYKNVLKIYIYFFHFKSYKMMVSGLKILNERERDFLGLFQVQWFWTVCSLCYFGFQHES